MSFPQSFIDELRARISVVDVVGRHVTWNRSRSNAAKGDFWACCPFHHEKTPSFHADDRSGRYYCFGCHEGGSAIDFLMKVERLSFPEAVEKLAREAGMRLPEKDPAAAAREAKRKTLTDATEAAVKLFREELFGPRGGEARDYLAQRGLKAETVERFEIGLAPRRGADALAALQAQGFSMEQLLAVDLARPSENGPPYHPFHGRLMFPIRDPRGRCVGFGGRALEPGARAKYLNSRETELYSKSKLLYNFGPARAALRDGQLIVAEGYMDVIALAQAGFETAVAPLGTALTEDQLDLLWRVSPEPLMALDGDRAGVDAAHRAAELALPKIAPGRSLAFVLLPEGQDPDDLVKSGGPDAMREQIAQALPLIELLWRRERDAGPLDTPERKAGLEARLTALSERILDEPVRKNYFFDFKARMRTHFQNEARAKRAAGKTGFQSGRFGPPPGATAEARANALSAARKRDEAAWMREAAIVAFALANPEAAARCESEWSEMELSQPDLEKIRLALLEVFSVASSSCESEQSYDDALDAQAANAAIAARIGSEELDRLSLLTRGRVRQAATPEDADATLLDMIQRQGAEIIKRREVEAYRFELENGGDDTDPVRLREALRAAHLRRAAPENDENGEYSAKLQSFVDGQPWKKKRKRRL